MAIAKVVYKESAEATPVVWIDTTDKTAAAGNMLSGTTALKSDGTTATGNIATKTSANLSASGATVTAPAGYYASDASKSVASGTEGTPTATKGTVSSHSVSVTPSVTNTAGYISGGTHTGTAVTVSASELVSGTKSITASGTTDVTNYASASVAAGSAATPATSITANPSISVSSGGLITASVSASQNVTPTVSAGYVSSGTAGTITVSGSNTEQLTTLGATTYHPSTTDQTIASGKYLTGTQTIKAVTTTNLTAANIASGVTVKIGDSTDDDCVASITGTHSGGGGGLEYEEGTWTPTADIARATISFQRTHSEMPIHVVLFDISSVDTLNADNCTFWCYDDAYLISGYPFSVHKSSGMQCYSIPQWVYTTSTSYSAGRVYCTYPSSSTSDISSSYPRYWVTETGFHPYSNSASRYFRAGRSYKWFAAWGPTT